jgi:hypothetical protein
MSGTSQTRPRPLPANRRRTPRKPEQQTGKHRHNAPLPLKNDDSMRFRVPLANAFAAPDYRDDFGWAVWQHL